LELLKEFKQEVAPNDIEVLKLYLDKVNKQTE